ncbi:Lysine methyltransferase [Rhizoctonia solani]|uniref:Lysine methyltransferase n=1 Tax=Rhizoctonia solani TaxID=456999 RepID=A0A8H7LKS8_9AGAM|nr:Lysine methyltransferase [Rhizoctonia solani]
MLEPAHTTKHLPFLHIPFREHVFVLAQADDGVSNGTTLWLGGQLLAAYIASLPIPPKSTARVIELGSGIGLTALVLASLGYHVLATDGHPSVLALLTQNIQRNAQNLPGSVQVRELDWCVPPERWDWSDPSSITSPRAYIGDPELRVAPPVFDLIVTADTLYVPHLTPHLLRTLDHLQALTPVTGSSLSSPSSDSNHQPKVSTNRARQPTTLVAFERRDPALIDAALALIPGSLTRIPHKKLSKALQRAGWKWDASDWDGVEIWKIKWGNSK